MGYRKIVATSGFGECVDRLGGWRAVDEALERIIDSLSKDPYGFPSFENDFTRFRYARVDSNGYLPSLLVVFFIDEEKNVVLDWCEEDSE